MFATHENNLMIVRGTPHSTNYLLHSFFYLVLHTLTEDNYSEKNLNIF